MDRIDGFQIQVMNEGSIPARQITVTLKTWQIGAPGPDVSREFEVRDLAPSDDFTFHIEPFYLSGEEKYDQERVTKPTCGYIVVRSINSSQPRAWAFFIPGQAGIGQPWDQRFFAQHYWPAIEFEYPKNVPEVAQCIDYPTGICDEVGAHEPWKPQ